MTIEIPVHLTDEQAEALRSGEVVVVTRGSAKTLEIPTMAFVGGLCSEHGWWHGSETCPDCIPTPSE